MTLIESPIFLIGLRDSLQGFDMDDIETEEGRIGVVPAIGTLDEARKAVRKLSKASGLPSGMFRILKHELTEVIEG